MLEAEECHFCEYCNFLLIKCIGCNHKFCEKHINFEIHQCKTPPLALSKVRGGSNKDLKKLDHIKIEGELAQVGLDKCCNPTCRNHITIICQKCQHPFCSHHLKPHNASRRGCASPF